MASYDRNELSLTCPVCKKEMKVHYSDVYDSRRTRCSNYSCGAEIHFDSSAASNFKYALQELERAQEKVAKAQKEIMNRVEIKTK